MDNKIVNIIKSAIEKRFDEEQSKPFQYVVAYYTMQDKLIGYHADSFCTLTQDKESAKRYNGEDPYGQLKTIRKNLDYILDYQLKEDAIFGKMTHNIKEEYYKDYKKEDIYINAEYLEEGIPSQKLVFNVI